jgi:CRP-like cAMP-binding protein
MSSLEFSKIPMLEKIDCHLLDQLQQEKQIFLKKYCKGHTIHQQQEMCQTLDIVRHGKLVAYALGENGSAITMFEFFEGDSIGANLLFGDQHRYPLNIYSVSDCTMVHLTREAVQILLHEYDFTMRYIQTLSLNSQGMNQKIITLTQKGLRENLMIFFKKQAFCQHSETIQLPMSKKELAEHLGVQRPSLFRELKKLKDEGVIKIEGRKITFVNNEKMF